MAAILRIKTHEGEVNPKHLLKNELIFDESTSEIIIKKINGTIFKFNNLNNGGSSGNESIVCDYITINTSISNNHFYAIDTTNSPITIILPSVIENGFKFGMVDCSGTWDINPVIVNRNGHKIMKLDENFIANKKYTSYMWIYFNQNIGLIRV